MRGVSYMHAHTLVPLQMHVFYIISREKHSQLYHLNMETHMCKLTFYAQST